MEHNSLQLKDGLGIRSSLKAKFNKRPVYSIKYPKVNRINLNSFQSDLFTYEMGNSGINEILRRDSATGENRVSQATVTEKEGLEYVQVAGKNCVLDLSTWAQMK